MTEWAAEELAWVRLKDKRHQSRLVRIVERLAERPAVSIPAACQNWAETKGAYRFFGSGRVDAEAIRLGHQAKTLERMQGKEWVIVAQDSSELNFTGRHNLQGLGGLRKKGEQGLYLHSGLAISIEGVPLGLLYQHMWAREIRSERTKYERQSTPTKNKESQRWIDTLQVCQQAIPEETYAIIVADREADRYDLLVTPRRSRTHLLIRAVQNRRINHSLIYLQEAVRSQPLAGIVPIEVQRQVERPSRNALLEVRYLTVEITPPLRGLKRKGAQPISVQVVLAQEMLPPAGEEAICWWLLTTLPVQNFAEAKSVLHYYAYRWLIERYHFVLKSGCHIEELQMESSERLERALATYSIVAWRLLWLTYLARQSPSQSCEIAFEPSEWQSLYCTVHNTPIPPQHPPSLQNAMVWVAHLGGFLGRKGDGEPGVKTIWRGLRRLSDISATWSLLHPYP